MAENKEILVALDYTIPVETFKKFSVINTSKKFEKRIKKTNISSTIQLVIAFLLCVWVFASEQRNQFVILLCVILLALGFYSFIYYRVLFGKIIEKTAGEGYQKSEYLKSPVHLDFYSTHMCEKSREIENNYKWQDIVRVVWLAEMALLELSEGRTIIIPKTLLGDDVFMLEELLKTVTNKYSKAFDTVF